MKLSEKAKLRGMPVAVIEAARKFNTGRKFTEERKEKNRISRAAIMKTQPFKFKDTKPELKLQEELLKQNLIFEKHVPLIGQPDIFIEPNICIFVDGDLYYVNPNRFKATDIVPKINMLASKKWEYDNLITNNLINQNYIVLRFWENDIYKNMQLIMNKIENAMRS
jgi:G:T-mismatch repair DNA endonuclease (very short patch repair protein)